MTAYIGVSHQYTVNGPGDRTFTVYTQNVGADGGPRQGDRVRLTLGPAAYIRRRGRRFAFGDDAGGSE